MDNKKEYTGNLRPIIEKKTFSYTIALLIAAIVMLVFAAYLGSESLQSFGKITFWLSIVGRCFSWLMDYAEMKK